METKAEEPYFLYKLKQEFQRRSRRNPSYSMRAYALDLGLIPATLSAILRGQRGLAKASARSVSHRLGLSPEQEENFLRSVFEKKASLKNLVSLSSVAEKKLLDEDRHFHIIAEWEYCALLSLTHVEDFQASPAWIARRLAIKEGRAREVLENLMAEGLLVVGEKQVKVQPESFCTSDDIASKALQESHAETLQLAAEKLKEVPVEEREYRSFSVAINREDFPKIKFLIKDFFHKLEEFAQHMQPKTDVFQLAVQAYPLTEKLTQESSNEKDK